MPKALLLVVLLLVVSTCCASGKRLDVLLVSERFPGTDAVFVGTLRSALESRGYVVKSLRAEDLSDLSDTSEQSGRLLLLPNSACFPADSMSALEAYLAANGNILTIGGPPFSRQVVKLGDEWLTQEMLLDRLTTMPPGATILDFDRFTPSDDYRDTGDQDTKTEVRVVPCDVEGQDSAMEVNIGSCRYWEFQDIPLSGQFAPGDTVTTFWAKGSDNARKLIVAWIDSDGGRWNTSIDLTTSWKRYAITGNRFKHWRGPGGPDDRIDVSNVTKFKVGFENHDLRDRNQPATFWITDIRSMANPAGNPDFTQPTIETLSPAYKTYSTDAAALVPTFGSYEVTGAPALTGPMHVVCSLPRYRGLGFDRETPRRWIPVLAATKADGHIGGAASALYVLDDKEHKGAVWATFGIEDADYLATHRSEVACETASLVGRIDGGLYMLSAGVDKASYFEGKPFAGATVLNLGGYSGSVGIECAITIDPEYGKSFDTDVRMERKTFNLDDKRTICELGPTEAFAPGFYVAEVSMLRDGKLIDSIRQPFSIVESKPADRSELVTIEGDQFIYKGKPWFSLGINYRPVYVASMEEGMFWTHWCHPTQYDAEIVEMELDLMNEIGLNTVALILTESPDVAPGFVDFMERAHRHGLKCHVFVPGLYPTNLSPESALKAIRQTRLWERPAMFAYDVAWEVRVGNEEKRQVHDPIWKRWIEDRYGSVENAEKDWGFPLRRGDNGNVHGPTNQQISENGPWNRMVAAYRRFWDDELSRRYMDIRKVVESVDPYHPISARSGFGGTGTMAGYALPLMPVDLLSGAKHFDYISPEGYNFSGDRRSFREGGFTTLYGKFVSGGKPIYWAELGYTADLHPGPEKLEEQRDYYKKIYETFYETRSAGSAAWWWPGYLIWEGSDYSIINPDFTMRPSAHEFTKMAERASTPYPQRKPDYWIEIDRDLYAVGYAGMLSDKRAEYGKAVSDGKTVGLRTKGTGTDSANFPRIAIGNTPLDGIKPPKYLNGEFNALEVRDSRGKWVSLKDGDAIEVKAGQPVYARASMGNTAEAKWLAPKPGRPGGVHLQAKVGDHTVLGPIREDTPFLLDAEVPRFALTDGITSQVRVSFQLVVDGIVFGEKRYVTLVSVSP
ncbi:MAG: hypothetical protein KBC96_08800 [Armatimonadetes bacterium]|nr:hypothetical protein [Armatimonadota bacterium]